MTNFRLSLERNLLDPQFKIEWIRLEHEYQFMANYIRNQLAKESARNERLYKKRLRLSWARD